MPKKITLCDLLQAGLGENYMVASRLLDIRNQANNIASVAEGKMQDDGEYAKLHASNIQNWLKDIATTAELALDLQLNNASTLS